MNSLLQFGVYILVAIFCIVFCVVYSKKTKNGGADERQEKSQGKAATFSMIALILSNFLFNRAIVTFKFTFHTEIFFLSSMLIGLTVFLVVLILEDSFFTKTENSKKFATLVVIWLVIIGKFTYNVVISDAVENKILLVSVIIPAVTVAITFAIKKIKDVKKDE